ALGHVVAVAAAVPERLVGLCLPGRVGRAAAEHVLAGLRVPAVAEAAPGVLAERVVERCVLPRRSAVDADLDALDRRPAGPRAADERARAGGEEARARKEVRDP